MRARRVSGPLVAKPDRRYLSMEPSIRDGQVDLRFLYDPQDQRDLIGNVNFWVLDEEGLRRMINGEKMMVAKVRLEKGCQSRRTWARGSP